METGADVPGELQEITIHATEMVEGPTSGLPYAAPVEIIVEAAAWTQMTRHACEDLEHEVGGIMLGEIYEHEGRGAVRVTATLPARGAVNALASIQFTNDAWSQMEQLRRDSSNGEKLIGWYHTHPGLSVFFSTTDTFMHESFFTQPWHVALVLDPVQGDHRFYRWDGGKVKESKDFLLQCGAWPGPQPPLQVVLGGALRLAADTCESTRDERGALLGPALRRLAGSLRQPPPQRRCDELLPLLVAIADLPPEVVAAARRRLDQELPPDRPLDLAEIFVASRNHLPGKPFSITSGWLAQLVGSHHLHFQRLEATRPFSRTLEIPLAVLDLSCDEQGQLLLLTRERGHPLRLLVPSLAAQAQSLLGDEPSRPKLALLPVEVDWGPVPPPARIGRIIRGRRVLYLLTRKEIHVLSFVDAHDARQLRGDDVHTAAACGWDSFDIGDWSVDGADNLFVLRRPSREVWRYEALQHRWQRFPTAEVERPAFLCAGLSTLWVYDSARQALVSYGTENGRQRSCRPLGSELARRQISGLRSDGYRRLYLATDDELLGTR